MNIQQNSHDGVTVIAPAGRIDTTTSGPLEEAVRNDRRRRRARPGRRLRGGGLHQQRRAARVPRPRQAHARPARAAWCSAACPSRSARSSTSPASCRSSSVEPSRDAALATLRRAVVSTHHASRSSHPPAAPSDRDCTGWPAHVRPRRRRGRRRQRRVHVASSRPDRRRRRRLGRRRPRRAQRHLRQRRTDRRAPRRSRPAT